MTPSEAEVATWIEERRQNCASLAWERDPADRAGWLEDERYFAAVLTILHSLTVARAALRQIAKGEGAFNRNPLKHAENVIEEAKSLARAALGEPAPGGETT